MAKLCSHCGTSLPTDNARFCNHCGRPVGPPPDRPSSPGGPVSENRSRPALREQVAFPSSDQNNISKSVSHDEPAIAAWPDPLTHVSVSNPPSEDARLSGPTEQLDFPASPVPPKLPGKELHVKVWDQEDDDHALPAPRPIEQSSRDRQASNPGTFAIEAVPTSILSVPTQPQKPEQKEHTSQDDVSPDEDRDAERFDTVLLPHAQASGSGISAPPERQPAVVPVRENTPPVRQSPSWSGLQPVPAPMTPIPAVNNQAVAPVSYQQQQAYTPSSSSPQHVRDNTYRPAAPVTPLPVPPMEAASAPVTQRKRPLTALVIVGVGLVVLCVLGAIATFALSPEGVAAPWKTFTATNQGFSMDYPDDWQAKKDDKKSQQLFFDANQTAQFAVTTFTADATDLQQFVRQQATKAGIADPKDAQALSFASASWQTVQGDLTREGVKYHMTFLVTKHGNQLYLITQQATQSTYQDNERIFFSHMRASWKFV